MRREGGREGGRDHMAAFLDSAGAGALCATSVPATVLRIYLQFLLGSRKVNIELLGTASLQDLTLLEH